MILKVEMVIKMNKNFIPNSVNKFINNNIKSHFTIFEEKSENNTASIKKQKLYLLYGETYIKLKAIDDTKSFSFSYSIPIVYANQIPILLEISKGTLKKVNNFYITNEKQKPNKNINFKFLSIKKDETLKIYFKYWILVKNKTYRDIPSFIEIPKINTLSKNVNIWLKPSKSIQSDNIFIRIRVKFLRLFGKNLFKHAKRIVFDSCYHRLFLSLSRKYLETISILHYLFLPNRYWTGLNDAVSYLIFGGLCGGKSNYETALFRASGIPARVLISTTMYYGKKLWLDAQHFLIEFYCPNYGWIPAMSGRIPYQPKNFIILKIVNLDDENIAGNGLSYYGGTAPWFWISDKKIIFDFPEKLISYKKLRGWGVPAVRGWIEKSMTVNDNKIDETLNLTKDVWKLHTLLMNEK
jgi:hypothetical protein